MYSLTRTVVREADISLYSGWMKKARRRRTKEGDSLPAIQESVVVGQSNYHDGANDNLAVDDYGLLLDGVHTYAKTRSLKVGLDLDGDHLPRTAA